MSIYVYCTCTGKQCTCVVLIKYYLPCGWNTCIGFPIVYLGHWGTFYTPSQLLKYVQYVSWLTNEHFKTNTCLPFYHHQANQLSSAPLVNALDKLSGRLEAMDRLLPSAGLSRYILSTLRDSSSFVLCGGGVCVCILFLHTCACVFLL